MKTPLLLLSLGALLVGCAASSSDDDATTTAASEDELTELNEAQLVELDADHVIYPARLAKSARVSDLVARTTKNAEPVYLVGDRRADAVGADRVLRHDATNRNGYLRRVLGVETATNGDVVFTTRKASLTEAEAELARKGFRTLAAGGCSPNTVNPFDLYDVDLSRVLYERTIGSLGKMSIRLKDSHLTVDGSLETQVDGSCLNPDAAKGILTLDMKGQIVLEGAFDGAFGAATGEVPLFHEQIAITSVLGYPLALDFRVTGDCEFSSTGKVRAEVGAAVKGSVKTGATWGRGDGFDTSFTPSWSGATPIGPRFSANASVTASCTVRAKALALVFDSNEGPYAEVATKLGLDATGTGTGTTSTAGGSVRAKGTVGLDVGIGGSLKPFHVTLIDRIEAPRYRKEWTLFDRPYAVQN
ncbi:MAG: hypothetical protein KIT84_36005 [Labilithrix sp.]|nr:hypothetical protein [Labilithrix sp.]MCW5816458.1 hypothetical protein [Labilithrix sp.]